MRPGMQLLSLIRPIVFVVMLIPYLLASRTGRAAAPHVTEGTAKNHVSSIIEKLGLRDRTQAALWALRHGL